MLTPGARVERFEVVRYLGGGGTADVYVVRHSELGTHYALKVLAADHASLAERLLQEGRIQAHLKHPNVVSVVDVLTVGQRPALLLELVEGPSLARLAEEYRPSLDQIDTIARDVLEGVAAAHAAGIVHRDLKPHNVLIEPLPDGVRARVTDFGIAKLLAAAADLRGPLGRTRTGLVLGTPRYMAPEQIRSAAGVDARTDVFALGCVLYELLCGAPPFFGDDLIALYQDMARERYRPLREWTPSAPRRMKEAIEAALRSDPAARPADARALRELWCDGTRLAPAAWELEHLAIVRTLAAAGSAERIAPTMQTFAAPAPPRTRRWLLGAGGLAVAGASVLLWPMSTERPFSPAAPLDPPIITSVSVEPAPVPARAEVAQPASNRAAAVAAPRIPAPPAPVPVAPKLPRWSVTGADAAWLVDAAGARHPPGTAPPGRYRLQAQFGSGDPVEQLTVDLDAGEHRVFTCVATLKVCR